jgi:hypothetical protein
MASTHPFSWMRPTSTTLSNQVSETLLQAIAWGLWGFKKQCQAGNTNGQIVEITTVALTAQNNTYTMQIDRWKAFYLVSAESSIKYWSIQLTSPLQNKLKQKPPISRDASESVIQYFFEDVKCVGWAVVNDNTFTVGIAQESFFFLLDVC